MARGLKFRIKEVEGFYYPYSENKGADQLRGYREANLRLCFRICKKLVFSLFSYGVLCILLSCIQFEEELKEDINAHETNRLSHPYQLDECTFRFKGIRSNFLLFISFFDEILVSKQNSPRWTPRFVAILFVFAP